MNARTARIFHTYGRTVMNQMMKTLRAVAAILVGLTVGAYAFLYVSNLHWPLWLDPQWQKLGLSAEQSNRAYRLYQTADYQAAKEALIAEARRLDVLSADAGLVRRLHGGVQPRHGNAFAEGAIATYVRLAKLEGKQGSRDEAEQHMSEAVARCQRLRPVGCSREGLRRGVDQVDATKRRQFGAR